LNNVKNGWFEGGRKGAVIDVYIDEKNPPKSPFDKGGLSVNLIAILDS
jgi:hypothetical protein